MMTILRSTPSLPEHMLVLLRARLSWISDQGWVIVESILIDPQVRPSALRVATGAGLRSRHQLAYRIEREGLPPYKVLASWLAVLLWLSAQETGVSSLCKLTLEEGLDPAYRYRMAKRLLGQTWKESCQLGLGWAIERFAQACSPPDFGEHHSRPCGQVPQAAH